MAYKYIPLSKEATYRLIERAKNGDEEAKEEIVRQNTGLVKNLALKFTSRGYELEDLMQLGFIGLLKAVERFDASFDVMFSTYAVPMILGEIRRHLRDDGRIKVSRRLKAEIGEMTRLREEYYRREGAYPRISELAELMRVSREDLLEIMAAQDALSGTESFDDPERPVLLSELPDAASGGQAEERRLDMLSLKSALGELPERERKVIILRYFKDMTQAQIAGCMGISQVQVSRIEKKAIGKLREKT